MKIYKPQSKDTYLKLLIYGKPGAGKTTLASTAADSNALKEVLFINVEGGLLTVLDKDISAIDIGRDEDGKATHNIGKDLEKIIFAIASKSPGYENIRTVVLDSASEFQTKNLEDVVLEGNAFSGKKHDEDVRIMEDFGKDTTRLKRLFRMLKDLNVNVIFTAIAKTTTNKVGDIIEVAPALTPKVAEALMAYVDSVWYLYKNDKTGERELLTEEKGAFRAKTRNKLFFNKLGLTVKNPTLPVIFDLLNEVIKNGPQ